MESGINEVTIAGLSEIHGRATMLFEMAQAVFAGKIQLSDGIRSGLCAVADDLALEADAMRKELANILL